MSQGTRQKIALIVLGKLSNPLVDLLLQVENIDLTIICSTILDYKLLMREGVPEVTVRNELTDVLSKIASSPEEKFPIPDAVQKHYSEELKVLERDERMGILYTINQIEAHSNSQVESYEALLKETKNKRVRILPLNSRESEIFFRWKKECVPLRYYSIVGKLNHQFFLHPLKESKKVKGTQITGFESLKELKIPEVTQKVFSNSELVIIAPTDLVSFTVFLQANELIQSLRKFVKRDRLVLLLRENFKTNTFDEEILEQFQLDTSVGALSRQIGSFVDYCIINTDNSKILKQLRDGGAKVFTEEFPEEVSDLNSKANTNLLTVLFGISQFLENPQLVNLKEGKKSKGIESSGKTIAESKIENETQNMERQENLSDKTEESPTSRNTRINEHLKEDGHSEVEGTKQDLQEIIDSNEIHTEVEQSSTNKNSTNSQSLGQELSKKDKVNKKPNVKAKELKQESFDATQESVDNEHPDVKEESYNQKSQAREAKQLESSDALENKNNETDEIISTIKVSTSPEESVKNALDRYLENFDEASLTFVQKQVKGNPELQNDLVELLFSRFSDINLIVTKEMWKATGESLSQVFSSKILHTITTNEQERRRDLISFFQVFQNEMVEESERIIKIITHELIRENENPLFTEISKITLLQMVINSKRLKRVAIDTITTCFEDETSQSATVPWTFLLCFDAGSVAIRLLTKYSVKKTREIIKNAKILLETGSFLVILEKVLDYWEQGDTLNISLLVGTSLTDTTMEKLAGKDLLSTIQKLRTVPLSTLADILGMTMEKVEKLVGELIVRENSPVEIEIVDNRLIVLYQEHKTDS